MKSGLQVLEPRIGSKRPGHCPSHPLYISSTNCRPVSAAVITSPLSVAAGRDTALQGLRRRPPCPCSASGRAEGHMPTRPEETPGMGKAALANVFTRLWHSTALPGCCASSLHQQIASIPFLQELPRAPRKGEKQMGGTPAKATVVPRGCSRNGHMGRS